MIIYNVTVKVNNEIHEEWLNWMRHKHIPDVMNTDLFIKYDLFKIINDDKDGITYAIQYFCKNMNDLYLYSKNYAKSLQEEHTNKYKDRFSAFRTIMEKV